MTQEIIEQSESLFKKIEKISKFSDKYNFFPRKEAANIRTEIQELHDSLPDIESPVDEKELLSSEFKRRLKSELYRVEQALQPQHADYDAVLQMYAIPQRDLDALKPWLVTHKDKVNDAVERLFQTKDILSYELSLCIDIPSVRRQTEEFAAVHVQKYHRRLGKLLQELTQVGNFLRDIDAVASTKERSYFHPLINTLAIGIPAICYTTEDGNLHIRDESLIKLYGHEGMGHALNQVITKANGMPYFLMQDSSVVRGTMESVAQFYQVVIFEDLKNSPQTQRDLGIEHKFDEIYQDAQDKQLLNEYNHKFVQFGITVLADKSLGDPHDPETVAKRIEVLNEVAIDPGKGMNIIESYRQSYDSKGNLKPSLVGELMYVARPVNRALEEFEKQGIRYDGKGRSIIDSTLLKGFWTPQGYVDNARIKAEKYAKELKETD